MGKVKTIVLWACLSIALQIGVLQYIDGVVFAHSSDFNMVAAEEKKVVSDINITIPTTSKDIRSSFDGKYITYLEGDKLQIVNTQSAETHEIVTEGMGEILNYKWLPDRNRIIIAEKIKANGSNLIKLITYDAKTGTENEVKEICSYEEDMEVDAITASVLTGVYYISVSRGGYNSTIYRIDINHTQNALPNKVATLGNMEVVPHKDILVYEDKAYKTFYTYTSGVRNKLNFKNSQNLTLITIDNEDIVYMGELDNGKVKRIIYGNIEENVDSWNTIDLPKAKDVKDIYVSEKSEILINDNLQGKVTNLSTNETVTYEGQFVGITKKVICSQLDGKIFLKDITKVDSLEE